MVENVVDNANKNNFPLVPSKIVILLRQKGLLDQAETIVQQFTLIDPFKYHCSWELGYSFAVIGRPDKAIFYLKRALAELEDLKCLLWLVRQYAVVGQKNDAEATLQRASHLFPENKDTIISYSQFVKFVSIYDRSTAKSLCHRVKDSFAAKTISQIELDINHALEFGKPYLLLRLGDGEGAHILLNSEDEAEYSVYYKSNRKEFTEIWFQDSSVLEEPAYRAAAGVFNESIQQADVIAGSMYFEAIQTEYDLTSPRGIAWVVNTMRKLLALADKDPEWASKVPVFHLGVHYDLLISGTLARVLQDRQTVGLISCHGELPKALQRTYGIERIEFLKVPGEQIHAETLGDNAVAGRHWPERFNEISKFLDAPVDRRGQIWLVAAGMLGKIYAAKLKNSGAVVLDIGAVADLWMGKVTRIFPNLPEELKLKPDTDIFTFVDVGGLGGVGEDWLPHIANVRAVLFEPNPPEAAMARTKIAASPGGVVIERALSNRAEHRTLHVTKSLGCTSLLVPNQKFLASYSISPAFRVTHELEVECVRFDALVASGEAPLPDAVKIDVQGFEYNILEGFGGALHHCLGVKVEAHLYPIYEGQKLLADIVDILGRAGLTLRKIEPVNHFDGDIVEVDAWFTCSIERINTLSTQRASKLQFLEKVWGLGPRRPSFGEKQFE